MSDLLNDLEELGFDTKIQLDEFLEYFRKNYSHVYNISLSDSQVTNFLKQKYVRRASVIQKANLFYDYIMSQGHCDYVE